MLATGNHVCIMVRQGPRYNTLADADGQLVAYIMLGAIAYTLPYWIIIPLLASVDMT